MSDDVRTLRIMVEGRVQGVGFRYFVAREAERRAIGGFARNLGDGRVEIVAQGDGDALAALCEACGRGPRGSQVMRVDITDAAPGTHYNTFDIQRDG